MRPHCGRGGTSRSRTTSERGATAQPRTTAPAARLATRNPPLKANVEVCDVVAHNAAVPATPARASMDARRVNQRRLLPSRHRVSPMAMAAPTSRACARVSVP